MSKSIFDECWATIQAWSWADGSMNVDVAARGKAEVHAFLEDYAHAKARVKELERQLADVLEGALQPETFDPQAVRELLAELDRDTHTVGSWHFVKEAAKRVRESEKK